MDLAKVTDIFNVANSIGIAGIIIAIAGVVVGVAYGRRSGRPVYKQTGNQVVTASPKDKITVQHAGQDVPRVTRTKISLWNGGRKTLEKADLVTDYPIRIKFKDEDAKILAVTMLRQSDEANKFNALIHESGSSVLVEFEYLDYRQGGQVEVLHTSEGWGAIVSGKVKGLPRGVQEVKPVVDMPQAVPLVLVAGNAIVVLASVHVIWAAWLVGAISFVLLSYVLIRWRRAREPRNLSLIKK